MSPEETSEGIGGHGDDLGASKTDGCGLSMPYDQAAPVVEHVPFPPPVCVLIYVVFTGLG